MAVDLLYGGSFHTARRAGPALREDPDMKERSDNKAHQQRFQGRHVRPPAPPVEAEKKGEPFGPNLEGASGNEWDKKNVPVPSTEKAGSRHSRSAL
jgi:hypothetical protein